MQPHDGFDPDKQRVDNLEFEGHEVNVTDVREYKEQISLESWGFQVLSHHSKASSFESVDDVEVYKKETEQVLREALGAEHVKCYDLRLRKNIPFHRSEFDLNNPLHIEGPARGAHNGESNFSDHRSNN